MAQYEQPFQQRHYFLFGWLAGWINGIWICQQANGQISCLADWLAEPDVPDLEQAPGTAHFLNELLYKLMILGLAG